MIDNSHGVVINKISGKQMCNRVKVCKGIFTCAMSNIEVREKYHHSDWEWGGGGGGTSMHIWQQKLFIHLIM